MTRRLACLALLASTVASAVEYRVRLSDGRVVEIEAEEYVAAVVAGEAGTLKPLEARKAMAVAARTYAFRMAGRHRAEGFDFCVTTHCQRALPGVKEEAAVATAGELLWWHGKPAFTVYSQDCGGRTEAAAAVWPAEAAPYLSVHDDPYCRRHGGREWSWTVDWTALAHALLAEHLRAPEELGAMQIVERTEGGRAKVIRLKGEGSAPVTISASSLRFAVGRHLGWNLIRSDINNVDDETHLRGHGQGHGVGLCQRGAAGMAEESLDYRAILRFYYPGTAGPSRAASGFEWTRLGTERLTVLTATPERDEGMPRQATAALFWAEKRLQLTISNRLELRLYPDTAAFRDATGEPGWVAARYRPGRIDLQPQDDLTPTLRHEMVHAVIETNAAADLPEWFREGLTAVLCGEASTAAGSDGNVRDRGDRASARAGYNDAARRVKSLVARYGEATVLSWIRAGLPPPIQQPEARQQTADRPHRTAP